MQVKGGDCSELMEKMKDFISALIGSPDKAEDTLTKKTTESSSSVVEVLDRLWAIAMDVLRESKSKTQAVEDMVRPVSEQVGEKLGGLCLVDH